MADKALLREGRFSVVPARVEHLSPIAWEFRSEDREECLAAAGLGPYEALEKSLEASRYAWTVLEAEKPVAMFGVAEQSIVSPVGRPWLLGAEGFSRAGKGIVRYSRQIIRTLLELYPRLENYVDARYEKSVRWLRWCGFTLDPPAPYGPQGMLFHRFWMTRG